MLHTEINFIAVVVTAIVIQVIGIIWYSPALFGKSWSKLMGFGEMTEAQAKKMKEDAKPAYLGSFLSSIIMTMVIGVMIGFTGFSTPREAVLLAALCWLGFVATVTFTNALYANKKLSLYMIDAGYQFVSFLVAALMLTAPFWG